MLNRAGLLRVEKTLSFIYNSEGQHASLYLQIDFFFVERLTLSSASVSRFPTPSG